MSIYVIFDIDSENQVFGGYGMIDFTMKQVIDAVGAVGYQNLDLDKCIDGVTIDSRNVDPNNLFVPLIGARVNGHDFVVNTLQKGAVVSFW